MSNHYNFSNRSEHKIVAALVLEKLCQLAEARCLKAAADCELEREQMLYLLGSNRIDATMKAAIIMRAVNGPDMPEEVYNLADKLDSWLPGRPAAPLEIIRQRTGGIAGLLLIQAAQQLTGRNTRTSHRLTILSPRPQ